MLPIDPGMPLAAAPRPAAWPGSPVTGPGRLVAAGFAEGPPFAVPQGAPTLAPPGFRGLPPPRQGPGGLPLPPPLPATPPGQTPLLHVPPQLALSRIRAAGQSSPAISPGTGTGVTPIAPVPPPRLPAPGSAPQR